MNSLRSFLLIKFIHLQLLCLVCTRTKTFTSLFLNLLTRHFFFLTLFVSFRQSTLTQPTFAHPLLPRHYALYELFYSGYVFCILLPRNLSTVSGIQTLVCLLFLLLLPNGDRFLLLKLNPTSASQACFLLSLSSFLQSFMIAELPSTYSKHISQLPFEFLTFVLPKMFFLNNVR